MAIEFARCVVYSRSQGKNAVRAAAYRSASRLYDERTGQWFDFTKKQNVVHSVILLPEGADPSFLNRELLWSTIEKIEKRRDSQLAKDYILALPKELTLEQNIELARQFAYEHFVSKGLVVDMNIHWEDGNPHVHLFVTTRRLFGKTFSLKARDLNPEFYKGAIVEQDGLGGQWRNAQDRFFIDKGIDLEVDPNHLIPTRHRGRTKGDNRAAYIDEENTLRADIEREIALTAPETVLKIMSEKHGAFTEKQLETVLKKVTKNEEELKLTLHQVLAHSSILNLGPGDNGRIRYTTYQDAKRVGRAEEQALELAQKSRRTVTASKAKAQVEKYTLNTGQERALHHVLTGGDLALIVGKAGTGKSYLMNAAREVWEAEGHRVLGIAVAGIASESLEGSSNIKSSTIASFLYRIENGKLTLTDKDVIVLDEAGMGDDFNMCKVIDLVHQAKAKLVMIGDPEQTQSPGAGALYRALLDRVGFAELTANMRQKLPEDRIATHLLSIGSTSAALDIYAHKGQVFLSETEQDNLNLLMEKWGQHVTSVGMDQKNQFAALMKETLIFTHRNEDVALLNKLAREHLIKTGMLKGQVHTFTVKDHHNEQNRHATKTIELMVGERILFLKNDGKLNVKNGHFATVTKIEGSIITAEIGSGDKARTVTFDVKQFNDFDYGYAATVNKTQGVTLDTAFVYAGGTYWSRNLTYVAHSRHRYNVYLFADKETHRDYETLKKNLGRLSIKDSIIDYPLDYAIRRGVSPESALGQCLNAYYGVKTKIKDAWSFIADIETYNRNAARAEKEELKQTRRQDAVKVAEYIDLHREIGRNWAEMKRTSIPGTELSEHPDFSKNYDLIIERNRRAHVIQSEIHKYELAIELNDVSLADLKRFSEAHEARERVLRYEALAKAGKHLEAGKVATLIRESGKAHGQFVRERGLSWGAINQLSKAYEAKKLLYSLDRTEREPYEKVMTYLAQGRSVAIALKRKTPDPELALFPTSERNGKLKLERVHLALKERDKLAHHIYTHQAEFAQAIEHFKIPLDKLAKEAKRHEYREAILAFIHAEQKDQKHAVKGQEDKKLHALLSENIAYNIKQSFNLDAHKKICSSVIRELEFKGMEWKKLNLSAWAYGERRKGNPKQKAAMKAYAEYRSLNRELAHFVGRNKPKAEHPAHKQTQEQQTLKYQRIKAAIDKRDQAAHQLWDELINLDERALSKLNVPRLQKESETHIRREEVKAFKAKVQKNEIGSLQAELAAERFIENPVYERLLKEQRVNGSAKFAAKALVERRVLASLNPEERRLFAEAQQYRSLTSQTAKAWKRVHQETKSDQAIQALAQNTELARAYSEQRNALAAKIYHSLEQYSSHLTALNIDPEKLKKAAQHHQIKKAYEARLDSYRSQLEQNNTDLKRERYNADRISEALIDMGESFYQKVLGDLYTKPKRYGHNIRVGEKAFFSFNTSGPHRGAWKSFESGECGYPLQLIMNHNYGYGITDFEEVLKVGAQIAGLTESQAMDITYVRKQKTKAEIEAEARLLAQEKQKKIETARYYYRTSQPITGTIAEKYLRETRHIEGDLTGFRFHPRVKDPETNRYYPAAIIAAKDEQGRITASQTILIDPTTMKKAQVEVPKRTRGAISGSVALVHPGTSNIILMAEGPETAASLIKAMPEANIYVTVGNIRNAEHLGWLAKKHNTNVIYFATDNDGANLKPVESLKKAVQQLEAQGIKCYKAVPHLENVETPDFNDVLIHKGVEGVKAQLNTMSRVLNPSEKITLGLTSAKEVQPVKAEAQKPEFWVSGDRIHLGKPLLEQVERYVILRESINLKEDKAIDMTLKNGNKAEIAKLRELVAKEKAEQLAISQALTKHETLWKKAESMNKDQIVLGNMNLAHLKAQIKQNALEPLNIQRLHQETIKLTLSHEKSLQQSNSIERSF